MISASKGENGKGEKRRKMEIKMKRKSVKGTIPILSFSLIRSKGGKDYQKIILDKIIKDPSSSQQKTWTI